ncbi:UDP-N-acetylmuramoylalanine--D-glutamate ligase [Camellia lanceoleosa]|uniref:UDP-N-acetylmuramoylalanine--D-glutamate ligase n=1 Tax=Camellia lanceoleosa TaxID=1840588 RepID=A0ACC0GCZ1_9ERIC|nr:UDP-N-acetylmuramoylalanine--D-glutamate ligase [Camellia lanceoleosa]
MGEKKILLKVIGLEKSGLAAGRLALIRGASVLAIDQNENLDPFEGKHVTFELDFAAEVLPRCTKILAVTGTNGKSTVATFAGQDELGLLFLSSFRNLFPGCSGGGNQHLNDAVRSSANDFNLAWIGAFPGVRINLEAKVVSFRIPAVQGFSELQLSALKTIGTHNYHNAAVAALSVIGLDIGIDAEAISSAIGKLKVPPHRMEIVHRDNHGVIWVDDSKATNVEATYTGLMGLKGQKSVILLGGVAKVAMFLSFREL